MSSIWATPLLTAQLLFGDLYNARMCNAIHALPVTRESLFGSHTAAGLVYSVGPTVLAAVLALLLGIGSTVEAGWHLPFYWLICANAQYLFFFALASFCALCVGNRLAQAVVYGIVNFASVIVYWLVDTLYVPLLMGVQTDAEPFMWFSPVVWFANSEYIDVNRDWTEGVINRAWYEISDGWGYLALCALLGIALLAAACALYRRRQLECAGDFMAVKALEPVFLVVYPLIVAAVFHFICDDLFGMDGAMVYMAIGLTVGFFTGLMLIERRVKVFGKKAFLKFAALALGFALTLGITALDPLGITRWVPDAEDVAYVTVSPSHSDHYYYDDIMLDEPQEIADIIRVHELAIESRNDDSIYRGYTEGENGEVYIINNQTISIHYMLKNGTAKSRFYTVNLEGEAGDILIPCFNTLEAIFREYEGEYTSGAIVNATQSIRVSYDAFISDHYTYAEAIIEDPVQIRELMDCIMADAELGLMAQDWQFRPDPDVGHAYSLEFDMRSQSSYISVYTDGVNTVQWLMDHGYESQAVLDTTGYISKYPG